ncbi:MAG: carboxypeptidase-like regulatory domain-containing protein [Planctomycetota bacterium]
MRTRSTIVLALACCTLLPVLGCEPGARDLPELVPVSGSVTLDGEPLQKAVVTFFPKGTTLGVGGAGATDASGRYELKTGAVEPGVPVGEYRVTCSKMTLPDGSDYDPNSEIPPIDAGAVETLPARYSFDGETTLAGTVPSGGATIDFELTSK